MQQQRDGAGAMLKQRQIGLTLVELLIAIIIGIFVAGAAISIHLVALRSSSTVATTVKLNHELRAVMSQMTSEIRRSGFWNGPEPRQLTSATPSFPHSQIIIGTNRDCILYSYDANFTGIPADQAASVGYFGFRLRNNRIETYSGPSNGCTATASAANWQPVTDESMVRITQLEFRTVAAPNPNAPGTIISSQCRNLSTDARWELLNSDANASVQACNATSAQATTTYAAPSAGDTLYEVRMIHIRMVGAAVQNPNAIIAMNESVKVMNDRIFLVTP